MIPIAQLRTTGETLPAELRDQILALGAAAVPSLVEILLDEELADEHAPAEGWPPIHAVGLLADLKATEAIAPLLDVLVETDSDHVIHDRIQLRLPELGAPVLEPAIARLIQLDDDEQRYSVIAVLADLGVRDERIFEIICDALEDDLSFGAHALAAYGDPRGVEVIEEVIDIFEPDYATPFWRADLTQLLEAHAELGGQLDEVRRGRVEVMDQVWEARSRPKVGRNDPCPCGSGKKYKKCCLGKPTTAASSAGAKFTEFARPFLTEAAGDREAALTLARAIWELALEPDDDAREASIEALLDALPADLRPAFDTNIRR